MRRRALQIFLGALLLAVAGMLLVIQSGIFAGFVKTTLRRIVPTSVGIGMDFKDLRVLYFPPGIVINKPEITLGRDNALKLPEGTRLGMERIEITFQFFQLMTGAITVNALNFVGAHLTLELDPEIFKSVDASVPKPQARGPGLWERIIRFDFRSVALLDSSIDVTYRQPGAQLIRVVGMAKEVSVSKVTRSGEARYDLALDFANCTATVAGREHHLAALKAGAEAGKADFQLRSLSLQEGELSFHSSGALRGSILQPKSLISDLSFIFKGPLTELRRLYPSQVDGLVPEATSLSGQVRVEGRVSGDLLADPKELRLNLLAEGEELRYRQWYVRKFDIKGAYSSREASIEDANVHFENGAVSSIRVEADMSLKQPLKNFKASLDSVDVRQALGPLILKLYPLHAIASGEVEGTSRSTESLDLDLKASIQGRKLSIDNQSPREKREHHVIVAVPEFTAAGAMRLTTKGIEFKSVQARVKKTALNLGGVMDFDKGFNLEIQGDVDFSEIGKIADIDVRGTGSLLWTVKGPSDNIVLAFKPQVEDAYFLHLNLGKLSGTVSFVDSRDMLIFEGLKSVVGDMELQGNGTLDLGRGKDDVRLDVAITKGTLRDFDYLMSEYIAESVPWYPHEITGEISGTLAVTGKTDPSKLSILGDYRLMNVKYLGEIFSEAMFRGGYKENGFIAERILIHKRSGTITGGVTFSPQGVLSMNLSTSGLVTTDLDHVAGIGIPYLAPMALMLRVDGKPGAIQGVFSADLGAGAIKGVSVMPSSLVFRGDGSAISANISLLGGQGTARAEWGQATGSDGTLFVAARGLDFRPLLMALNPTLADDLTLEGLISGEAALRYKTGNFRRLSGSMSVEQFSMRKRGFYLKLASPLALALNQGDYKFSNLRLLSTAAEIAADGEVSGGRIGFTIKGDFPLALFEFLTPEIASFKGSLAFNALVSGTLDDPHLMSKATFSNADLRLAKIEQSFENITGAMDWRDDLIAFPSISAKLGGGTVNGRGTARLSLTRAPELNFRFDLNNPKFKIYPFTFLRASGRMSIVGDTAPYLVGGELVAQEALIQENFNKGGGKSTRSSMYLPSLRGVDGDSEFHLFDLNIEASADRGILVKNDLIDLEAKGKVRILGTPDAPRIQGRSEVVQGKILFNESIFNIQNAVVEFKNPVIIDPEFDLTAITDYKGYKVNLYASGNSSGPRISFKSHPPLSQEDIVSLLTLGVTSSGYSSLRNQDRDAYSRDEVYSLLFNQSGINRGLKSKFGVNVGVDQAMNTGSQESAFRRNADAAVNVAPKVVLQKEIVKNLNAKVGSTIGVGDSRQQDLNLEYQFGKNTSVTGVYEDQRGTTPQNSRTSMGVDLKFRWNFR